MKSTNFEDGEKLYAKTIQSIAKVYFTSLTDLDKETLEKEMNEASGYIRTKLASKIDLRHTPELKFIFDNSIEYGNHIERIIADIHKED